jgi:hypothetical protein
MLLNVLTSVVRDAGAFDRMERRSASSASWLLDRRLSDRERARRLRLRRGGARIVACCAAALISGCSSGRLDTFEVVRTACGGEDGALLIDDFEDQNNAVYPDGWWYAIADGTGPTAQMTFEAVTDRGDSRFAVHVAAGPTSGFGSFLGLDLPCAIFDATGFSVLSFWARMEPAGELSVRFQNARVTQFQQVRALGAVWREVRLPLADFVPVDDGGGAITLNELTHLQLWVPDTHGAYDLYVDDVWLLREP